MPIVKLSESFVRNNLQCPEGKSRIEYCDQDTPGLYIEVRATSPNEGTIYLRYKDISGITRHQKIARTTEITLAEARRQAKTLKAEIALRRNPKEEEKPKQSELTYERLFEAHYIPHKSLHKRSIEDDIRIYRLKIKPTLGHKLLHQINRFEIQALLNSFRDSLKPASCNHILKVIRHSLNLAVEWEFLESNPATKIPLFDEADSKVEHYLNDAELERLLTVLHTDENRTVCQIALFLLSTGCRLNEVLSAQWSDIDLEKKIFLVRASNSKSKRLRPVPLNECAMGVLNQLDTKGKTPLFLNAHTGKPYTTITKVWARLRKQAGLEHLRLHDLRHQYASFLVNSGRTLYEVQQILGHSDSKVTQRYAHLSTKTLQEAANSASAKIKKAMQPK